MVQCTQVCSSNSRKGFDMTGLGGFLTVVMLINLYYYGINNGY